MFKVQKFNVSHRHQFFVGLSKCEGKFRLELLLRFIRGPGISLSGCLFLSDLLGTACWVRGNSYVETADRQTDIASGLILDELIYVCRNNCRHLVLSCLVFLNVR